MKQGIPCFSPENIERFDLQFNLATARTNAMMGGWRSALSINMASRRGSLSTGRRVILCPKMLLIEFD